MAPEKTEALLVTDRKSFRYPKIVLGEHEVAWSSKQLDRRLSFSEHLRIARNKAIQCEANLAQLMPNIDGPREAKGRLIVSIVHSKLLYTAHVWKSALNNHAIHKRLSSIQRVAVMRMIPTYRTVSASAVLILTSVLPIDLLSKERLTRSRKLLESRKPSTKLFDADSLRDGRRDGMVRRP